MTLDGRAGRRVPPFAPRVSRGAFLFPRIMLFSARVESHPGRTRSGQPHGITADLSELRHASAWTLLLELRAARYRLPPVVPSSGARRPGKSFPFRGKILHERRVAA